MCCTIISLPRYITTEVYHPEAFNPGAINAADYSEPIKFNFLIWSRGSTRGFSLAGAMADTSCELRIDIPFWTDFCTHHEIQMNLF